MKNKIFSLIVGAIAFSPALALASTGPSISATASFAPFSGTYSYATTTISVTPTGADVLLCGVRATTTSSILSMQVDGHDMTPLGTTGSATTMLLFEADNIATSSSYIEAHFSAPNPTPPYMACANFTNASGIGAHGTFDGTGTSFQIDIQPYQSTGYLGVYVVRSSVGPILSAGTNTESSFTLYSSHQGFYHYTGTITGGAVNSVYINATATTTLGAVYFEVLNASENPSLAGLISAASADFDVTVGFTPAAAIEWGGNNLIQLFIGSGLAVLTQLVPWILVLIITAAIIFFAFRASQFFRH